MLPNSRIAPLACVVLAAASLLSASTALAKPLAGHAKYPGTLTATPNVLHAGDRFTVTGCNYNTANGDVLVTFTGGSWGSRLDSDGCFTVPDIPALSGDTLGTGTYEVRANQLIRGRWTETGETTVTVVN